MSDLPVIPMPVRAISHDWDELSTSERYQYDGSNIAQVVRAVSPFADGMTRGRFSEHGPHHPRNL